MNPPMPTKRESLEYVKIVKNKLQDDLATYNKFLGILTDYKNHRIELNRVTSMMKELFKKHPELIRGLNAFLPKDLEITPDDEQTPPTKSFVLEEDSDFLSFKKRKDTPFLTKVKLRFGGEDPRYTSFLEVFNAFIDDRLHSNVVKPIVKELFKEHPDLIREFNKFLPLGAEITLDGGVTPSPNSVVQVEALDFLTKVKTRFQDDDRKYRSFFNILEMYRKNKKCAVEVYIEMTILFRGHHDLLVEFSKFLPSDD